MYHRRHTIDHNPRRQAVALLAMALSSNASKVKDGICNMRRFSIINDRPSD
jgi:hypothetical protein